MSPKQISDAAPDVDCNVFVDPFDGETILEQPGVDAHGTDLIGEDDHGLWWGTPRAAWVLRPCTELVHVIGRLGAMTWDGWFIGSVEDAVAYAECHGVVVDETESDDDVESALPYVWA